uniref:PPPDE domain-containing protein n=1 Tax=Globodera rostochiensis TaxID=31243 RepID=A0A914HY47_GLORO
MSSHSSDPDTHANSTWVSESRPQCGHLHAEYRAVNIRLRSHRMFSDALHVVANAVTGNLITHHAVMISFLCPHCPATSARYHMTCDFSRQGKHAEWGRYQAHVETLQNRTISVSWSDALSAYDTMWGDGYDLLSNNCQRWATTFFKKVAKKSVTQEECAIVKRQLIGELEERNSYGPMNASRVRPPLLFAPLRHLQIISSYPLVLLKMSTASL